MSTPRTGTPQMMVSTRGLRTLPANVNVAAPVLAAFDGSDVALSLDQNGNLRVVPSLGTAAAPVHVVETYTANTGAIVGYGRVVAPGAGATIATVVPALGFWSLDVWVGYGGTAEAAAVDNFAIFFPAGDVPAGNQQLVADRVPNTLTHYRLDVVNVTVAAAISVIAIVAGSAGSVYKAQMILSPRPN